MKKFIQKIAAMAITGIMTLSSAVPAVAATSQDYVPTVILNDANAVASYTEVKDYTNPDNGMTILAVDTGYNRLEAYDTSVLTVGNMGGVTAPDTKDYNGTSYTFSHYEYATSVRNYVASYNRDFQFYVDPPMTILAVYIKSGVTYTKPEGPIVGMYKDPAKIGDETFFYLSEAHTEDLSPASNHPSITFGRSQLINTDSNNEETFNTQADNIYTQNNNFQFIAASKITSGGPINFLATAAGAKSMAQIKTWDFGTSAFDSVTANTEINGITLTDGTAVNLSSAVTIGGKAFSRGYNANASFTVYKGDVVKVYASGAVTAENGTVQTTGSATAPTTIIASANGTMTIYNNGNTIYAVTVNVYSSVDSNSATVSGSGSTEATYTWLASDLNDLLGDSFYENATTGSYSKNASKGNATFLEYIFEDGTSNSTADQTYAKWSSSIELIPKYSGTLKLYLISESNSGSTNVSIKNDSTTVTTISSLGGRQTGTNVEAITINVTAGLSYKISSSSYLYKAVLTTTASGGSSTTTTTGTIYGYVKDSTTNSAISGATVTLSDGQTATTSLNGSYSFTVTIGTSNSYTVTASKSGYSDNFASVAAAAGSVQADISLSAESTEATTAAPADTKGSISGTVTNSSTSAALSGILVELLLGSDQSVKSDTNTDENGNYLFKNVDFGINYILRFAYESASFISDTLGIENFSADKTDANIALTPKPQTVNATISVTPAAAEIKINGNTYGDSSVITLDIGTEYTVVSADTSAYTLTSVTPSATFTASTSTTAISATLTAADTPVVTAEEYVLNKVNWGSTGSISEGSTRDYSTFDSDKTNDIFTLIGGDSFKVESTYISLGGVGSTTNRAIKIDVPTKGTITVTRSGTDEQLQRTLNISNGSSVVASTTSTGKETTLTYECEDSGTYYIYSGGSGINITEVKFESSGPVTTGTITGTVKDQNGNTISDATVSCGSITAQSASDGSYTLSKVTAGDNLTVTAQKGNDTGSAAVSLTAGSSAAVDITIKLTTGTLQAVVSDSSGNAISGAIVTASVNGTEVTLSETSVKGTYSVDGINAGTYTVTATVDTTTNTAEATVVAASTGTPANIQLDIDALTVERQTKINTLITTLLAEDDPSDGSIWNSEGPTVYKWTYINGCMITAFMDMYEVTGEEKYYTVSDTYQSKFVNSDGTINATDNGDSKIQTSQSLDDVNPGKSLLDLIEAGSSNSTKYTSCVDYRVTPIVTRADRIEKKTLNFYHKAAYPYQVWLDGTYMALPYMVQYMRVTGKEIDGLTTMTEVANDVTAQFENVYKKLRNSDTGLYYHGYDSQADSESADVSTSTAMSWAKGSTATDSAYVVGTGKASTSANAGCSSSYWTRSMGWYAMALVDSYEEMGKATDTDLTYQKQSIAKIFTELMDSVLNYQDSSTGLWYQVTDNPTDANNYNYLESSGSATFAAALMKGYNLGIYTDAQTAGYSAKHTADQFYSYGLMAFNGLTDYKLNTTGGLEDICSTAGLGGKSSGHTISDQNNMRGPKYKYRDGTYEYYVSEGLAINDAKGAAPYLMAYAQKLLHDKNS